MFFILREIWDYFSLLMERYGDPRTIYLFHVPSPFGLMALLVFYIGFVTTWGPKIMKDRKPFELKYTMIVYNMLQIIMNACLLIQATFYGFIKERYSFTCQRTDFSDEPNSVWLAKLTTYYFFLKVLDLIDTVFMVLRKKGEQASFLHVHHHGGMVFGTWIASAFFPAGHFILIGIINCFVHMIMYFYYLLCAINPAFKQYYWWKKHLTELQMIQLAYMAFHCAIAIFNPFCEIYKRAAFFFMVQDLITLKLFWEFYQKAYLRKTESLKGNVEKKMISDKAEKTA